MAGWISSKLKVAETFLQQIDQQAAESLGKNVGPRSPSEAPGSSDEIPKRTDSALPLKYQLPKKSPPPPDIGHPRGKRLAAGQPPSPAADPDPAIADGDWTELLGSPKPASAAAAPDGGTTKKPMARKGSGSAPKLGRRPNFAAPEGELVIKGPSREEEREQEPPSSEVPSSRGSSDSRQGTPSPEESIKGGPGSGLSQLEIHQEDVRTLGLREMDSPSRDDKEVVGGDGRKSSGIAEGARPNLPVPRSSDTRDNSRSSLGSSDESESGSISSSTSDSENESKRRAERRRRRQQMLAEKMKAIAAEAIKERENIVARLEGEKQSLEKILVEREKKQAEEASELQMSMIETLEAVEKEKEKHNSTRMEALAHLAKLEATNAELARTLATNQWNLEMEVNRVAELWQQIELKELTQDEYKRKMSKTHQVASSLDETDSLRRSQLKQEMLGAEFSFICDKIVKLKAKAKKLEDNIEITRREMLHPTEVEVELKKRLDQLTDRLIQKQTQVESLSSEKATLMLRMEMVSKLLDESGLSLQANDFADYLETGLANFSARVDIEAGTWQSSSSALNLALHDKMRTGQQQLGSVLRQLDAIFSAGVVCLRRNSKAQIWSLLYLLCLHLWVMYILTSHSQASDSARPGAVFSLEAINKTSGS